MDEEFLGRQHVHLSPGLSKPTARNGAGRMHLEGTDAEVEAHLGRMLVRVRPSSRHVRSTTTSCGFRRVGPYAIANRESRIRELASAANCLS